jgi:hypothetical protein
MSVIFINAIKEQQEQLAAQQKMIDDQRRHLERQQEQIDALLDILSRSRQEKVQQ